VKFQEISVGGVYGPVVGREEGMIFEIGSTGAQLIYNVSSPDAHEIQQFGQDNPFEIRLATLQGVIFILARIGQLPWSDAPYNPHLSPNLALPNIDPEGTQGLGLTLMLTDAPSGTIKHLRLIGLGAKFTSTLINSVSSSLSVPMPTDEFTQRLREVYNKYTTKAMVVLARARYKL
jgi:hypothetical protein